VLRRIMRRAMRHAHLLGAQDPLMHRWCRAGGARWARPIPSWPRQALITETLKLEETRFRKTLDRGLKPAWTRPARSARGRPRCPARPAFKLYDTYGFPLDLTQDALRERGVEVDIDGFDAAMAAAEGRGARGLVGLGRGRRRKRVWFETQAEKHGATEFLGYDTEKAEGVVLALVATARAWSTAGRRERSIVVNQTPFYGESGGQVGDTGR
jgi:alanyl-tRNA synthetase